MVSVVVNDGQWRSGCRGIWLSAEANQPHTRMIMGGLYWSMVFYGDQEWSIHVGYPGLLLSNYRV